MSKIESDDRIDISDTPTVHRSSHTETNNWRPSLEAFTSKLHGRNNPEDKKLPKRVREFYRKQDAQIESFVALLDERDTLSADRQSAVEKAKKKAILFSRISLFANLVLLAGEILASYLSGSISFVTTAVDNVIDLVSGSVMWLTNRAIIHRDPYLYPEGKTRLEPIGIAVLCCVMAGASGLIVMESIRRILEIARSVPLETITKIPFNDTEVIFISDAKLYVKSEEVANQLVFDTGPIIIGSVTIGVDLLFYMTYRRIANPSIQALAQDHRNDFASNTVALAGGIIGYRLFSYADPIGAIVISIFVFCSWVHTGYEQVEFLTGKTAPPDFLQKLTWIAINHHPKIKQIDTVSAFHFGINYFVQIDIILPEDMNVLEAHNIGESLQQRLEKMKEIERAFVHIDYEGTHHPSTEHKIN